MPSHTHTQVWWTKRAVCVCVSLVRKVGLSIWWGGTIVGRRRLVVIKRSIGVAVLCRWWWWWWWWRCWWWGRGRRDGWVVERMIRIGWWRASRRVGVCCRVASVDVGRGLRRWSDIWGVHNDEALAGSSPPPLHAHNHCHTAAQHY